MRERMTASSADRTRLHNRENTLNRRKACLRGLLQVWKARRLAKGIRDLNRNETFRTAARKLRLSGQLGATSAPMANRPLLESEDDLSEDDEAYHSCEDDDGPEPNHGGLGELQEPSSFTTS